MQVIIGCKIPYSEISEGHLNKQYCDQCGTITEETTEDKCPSCHYENCMYPYSEPVSKYFVNTQDVHETEEDRKNWYHPDLVIFSVQSLFADEYTEIPDYLIFGLTIESQDIETDSVFYDDARFHKIDAGDIEKTKHVAQYLLEKEGLYSESQFGIYTLS